MLKKFFDYILKIMGLGQAGVFLGYLRRSGWIKSLRCGKPVSLDGSPLPWYCYPFLYFVDKKSADGQFSDARLFEFGSGQSTLWWAARVREVVSVEDSESWYQYVIKKIPENATCQFAPDEHRYLGSLTNGDGFFDIVVVDGSHRERAILAAKDKLTDRGVVIVDNADWPELEDSLDAMVAFGFRRLDFYGLGPVNGYPWCTTVLYRTGNILGI